jgi:hypothetical protein
MAGLSVARHRAGRSTQLRKVESERILLESKHRLSGQELGADQRQPAEINELVACISMLKIEARFLLALMYEPVRLDEEDRDYIYDLRKR